MASANEQAALLQQILGLTPVQQDYPLQDVMSNISRLPAGKKVPVPTAPVVPKKAPIEVDRESIEDTALKAKALTDVITPKSVWPLDADTFNQLLSRTTPALSSQRQGISDLEKQISGYDTSINPWLAGAGAVSDILGGTDNLSSLMAQKEKKELNKVALSEKLQSARDKLSDKEMDLLKAQFQNPFAMQDKSQLAAMTAIMGLSGKQQSSELGALVDIFKAQMGAATKNQAGQKSPGMDAADREFGREYSKWNAEGGFTKVKTQLAKLESAVKQLNEDPDLSGTYGASLPDAVRAYTNPKAVALKEQIRSAIAETLREIRGAAFTEREAEDTFRLAFNEKLPAAENITKVQDIITKLRNQAEEKDRASKYFEKTGGTLEGYKSTGIGTSKAPMSFEEWKKARGKK